MKRLLLLRILVHLVMRARSYAMQAAMDLCARGEPVPEFLLLYERALDYLLTPESAVYGRGAQPTREGR
jgi:hypothetical protein